MGGTDEDHITVILVCSCAVPSLRFTDRTYANRRSKTLGGTPRPTASRTASSCAGRYRKRSLSASLSCSWCIPPPSQEESKRKNTLIWNFRVSITYAWSAPVRGLVQLSPVLLNYRCRLHNSERFNIRSIPRLTHPPPAHAHVFVSTILPLSRDLSAAVLVRRTKSVPPSCSQTRLLCRWLLFVTRWNGRLRWSRFKFVAVSLAVPPPRPVRRVPWQPRIEGGPAVYPWLVVVHDFGWLEAARLFRQANGSSARCKQFAGCPIFSPRYITVVISSLSTLPLLLLLPLLLPLLLVSAALSG